MKKFVIAQVFTLSLLIIPNIASAQTTNTSTSVRPTAMMLREKTLNMPQNASREAVLAPKMMLRKENTASIGAILKQRLQTFKNKEKAKLVEMVSQNLTIINQNRTAQMLQNLNTMSQLLSKLETRVGSASTSGKDITAITSSIAQARIAISSASAAVNTQAAKEYGITVSTESTVNKDAQIARNSLFNDLKATYDNVVAARNSVKNAITTAISTFGGTNGGQ